MQLGLNKLPWYGQLLLFVVLSAVGIYVFHYLYADGQEAKLASKESELAAVRARVTKGNQIAQQLPAFQAEVIKLEAHLDGLKQVLPEQRDVGDMLRRIQTLATQSRMNVRSFRPQPVANKELHAEWPMMIEFDGNYHDLGEFFDRVSKVPRIINISGITIKAKDARAMGEQNATISAQCLATTFVLLDKPPAGAAAPARGARLSAQNTVTVR
jgi:type IV pilus assembly protein PilO